MTSMIAKPVSGAASAIDPAEARRGIEAAVATLRACTKRNGVVAGLCFVLVAVNALQLFRHGISTQIAGYDVLLEDGMWDLASMIGWLAVGVSRLWISPTDRLVLALAESILATNERPETVTESRS